MPTGSDAKKIVPRWEWRTFGDDLEEADRLLAGTDLGPVQDSDELYLVSLDGDASVKVRDGLMDVKRLEAVNDDGLEQWRPVLKAAFPLAAADVAEMLDALRAHAPAPARDEYSLDELVGEIVAPSPDLHAVKVHKHREHHTVDGCMTEVSELLTDVGARHTIAVESEDPALVVATVRKLGLAGRRNVNLPRGLKALVGVGAHRFATIDVGTNSVKLHVAERQADGEWRTIADRAEVARLGEALEETGNLEPEPMRRTVEAIAGMNDEARRLGVEELAIVGTAGLRIAANGEVFVDAVRERSGVEVEVISGDDEARLAYLAATSALGVRGGTLVVFDTGGGSSQFTFGQGDNVEERFSVNVGAARFTERFGLDGVVSDETLAAALDAVAVDLSRLDGRPVPDAVLGMGGAVTNLTAVKHELATYDADVVQGATLDRAEIDRQIELYRTRTADERREIVGLQPNRAEVILAGACIVRTVLDKLGRDELTVSDRGLRHGLLVERFALR